MALLLFDVFRPLHEDKQKCSRVSPLTSLKSGVTFKAEHKIWVWTYKPLLQLHSWAAGQSTSGYLLLKGELKPTLNSQSLEKIEILPLLCFPYLKSQHVWMGEKINMLLDDSFLEEE